MTNDSEVSQALDALGSADQAERIDSLHRLRAQRDERIPPRVLPLLRDHDSTIRRLAAEVLGKNGGTGVIPALIDALYDLDPVVRDAAVDALGTLGDRAAVPALIDALYDESIDVRFGATEALRLIPDSRAVVDLIHVLDNDDPPLAAMAAMALHTIGTPEALAAIQHLREGETYHFELFPEDVQADETVRHVSPEDETAETTPETASQSESADETVRHIPATDLQDYLEFEVAEPSAETTLRGGEAAEPEATPAQFSAYYPREAAPNVWNPLRAYVFVSSAASAVAADAAQELGALLPTYREVERTSSVGIARGALITAAPELPGFQFNPPSAQIGFYEDWQRFDFKLRALTAPPDQATNGRITFTVEGVIVADVPLSVYVSASASPAESATVNTARPIYQSIFCSYSHKDTEIVERVERAYKALGLTFLRDVISLRSGQDWDEQLLKLIDSADIFQLFWSEASSASPAVRKEWEHALGLKRENDAFIRPVYWQQPMPPPAPELAAIHFAFEPELGQP